METLSEVKNYACNLQAGIPYHQWSERSSSILLLLKIRTSTEQLSIPAHKCFSDGRCKGSSQRFGNLAPDSISETEKDIQKELFRRGWRVSGTLASAKRVWMLF